MYILYSPGWSSDTGFDGYFRQNLSDRLHVTIKETKKINELNTVFVIKDFRLRSIRFSDILRRIETLKTKSFGGRAQYKFGTRIIVQLYLNCNVKHFQTSVCPFATFRVIIFN